MNRRKFMQSAAALTALGTVRAAASGVSIVVDPHDPVASSGPARWAAKELEERLKARGVAVAWCESVAAAQAGSLCVVSSGLDTALSREVLRQSHTTVAATPEA